MVPTLDSSVAMFTLKVRTLHLLVITWRSVFRVVCVSFSILLEVGNFGPRPASSRHSAPRRNSMGEPKVCIDKLDLLPEGTVERMALLHGKLWGDVAAGIVQPGPSPLPLRVTFLDGSKALQKKVTRVASE